MKKIVEAKEREEADVWDDLELAILDARYAAFLLTAAVETGDDNHIKEDAIGFAAYEVQKRLDAVTQAFNTFHRHMCTYRQEGEDTAFNDDEGNRVKAVNLH